MRDFLRARKHAALLIAALLPIACGQAARTSQSASGTGGTTTAVAGTGGTSTAVAGTGGTSTAVAGTGGTSTAAGTGGGDAGAACSPAAPACGAAACGNGQVDTCPYTGPNPCGPTGCPPLTEDCDGTAFGGKTCASIGYAGGSLQCTATCTLDTSGCTDCAMGPQIQACSRMPFASDVAQLAMTTTDTQVGLAWLSGCQAAPSVRFAKLDATLSLLASSTVTTFTGAPLLSAPSIAATPSGWIVALDVLSASGLLSVEVFALDANGVVTATRTLPNAAAPQLVQRPGGEPLLTWLGVSSGSSLSDNSLHAAILGPDGSNATTPVTVSTMLWNDAPSGTWVGDGFLVAVGCSASAVPPSGGLQVFHIGLDGSASPRAAIPAPQAGFSRLAWNGTSARLTYVGGYTVGIATMPGTFWQPLASDGTLVGNRVQLDDDTNYYGAFPIALAGDSSLVVEAPTRSQGAAQLSVTQLDATGQTKLSPFALNHDPCANGIAIAPLGGAAIVAWSGGGSCGFYGGGVTLARVAPVP